MIRFLLKHGTLVAVTVIMLMVLGIVAATRVPVQMIPDLETRIISIDTRWPGATPQDVEKEILIEQEEYLRGLPNLKRMTSLASTGRAEIELEFPFGTNANEALLEVNNALSQVPSYPENVDEPVLRSDSFSYNPFLSFRIVPVKGNPKGHDINMMLDFVDDNVRPALERIEGVSQVRVNGGAERQIRIIVDAAKLAERKLSINDVRQAIRDRNVDVSAGDLDSGKRRYLLRTVGRFHTLDDLRELIIVRRGDSITRLQDIATVELTHAELRNLSYSEGEANIRLSLVRQTGSNVIDIKEKALPEIDRINQEILLPEGLEMTLSNDDVQYVQSSIDNVVKNIAIGASLATLVLFLFLRSGSATLIGMLGMPVCIVAGFIGLLVMDRTINVISLAGIAFAIGMTIDNTIVVLESIEVERRKGKTRMDAAHDGLKAVWTAVLSGTMTTVLVFLPILFVKEEAGQLFSDIGIAISASIIVSMLVATAVVPVAFAYMPGLKRKKDGAHSFAEKPKKEPRLIKPIGWLISSAWRRAICMLLTLAATAAAFLFLTPPAEYLPEGEEAKAFSTMIAPPGYSLKEMEKVALETQEKFLPALKDDPANFDSGESKIPALDRFVVIVRPESMRVIAVTKNPKHIDPYIDIIDEHFRSYPGMRAFSARGSIISSNDGGTRAVALDISGRDLPEIYNTALEVYRLSREHIKEAQINSRPSSLTLGQPLLEIKPKWERLEELGFEPRNFGFAAAALSDGAFVDEFYFNDDKIDIFLFSKAEERQNIEDITTLPIYSPRGGVIPVGAIASIEETVDTAEIRRVDGRRTVTLYIIPPRSIPLETGVQTVRENIVQPLRESGALPPGVSINLTGASDQLDSTRKSLGQNMWIAVVLCYLQLVVIYRHWGHPFLILTTVPIGISGGIVGLWLLNYIGGMLPSIGLAPIQQPFDMITMLGFLILLGTAVNNPILIVERTMQNYRENGLSPLESVKDAVSSRLRPVLMTTCTTLMGLAPLVFIPGAGTELYRGLGAIVLFGLAFTAFITLTFLPSMLVLVLNITQRIWNKPPDLVTE
ncbi:Multidrug efflux pump subunit AcrB [Rubritalea squalenifaciens DSM 18772]|uniref:Multidrug efflux pump subunit AcrB n=1 Tax=Rubritalea squalenifaciens DSM 18772 TaxID=1123071 RepID=A0A1M6QG67_9BACT|nr:efflux RND transporter permease subunit [Rubritalea squalenifaciens]SHK19043.1 Multidrug efflux pump subunit AcrB [Rubritalea squalenifaciens DSM 18772]